VEKKFEGNTGRSKSEKESSYGGKDIRGLNRNSLDHLEMAERCWHSILGFLEEESFALSFLSKSSSSSGPPFPFPPDRKSTFG
jgi:hypothetical protein